MAELLHHASLEHIIQSEGAPEYVSQLPYAQSHDQHTRVKKREQALSELKVTDPTAVEEQAPTLTPTGKMLLRKAHPDNFVSGKDNTFGILLNLMVHKGGSIYVPDAMEAAKLTASKAKKLQIANVVKINPVTNSFETPHWPEIDAIPKKNIPPPVPELRLLHEGVPIALAASK